MLIARWYDAEGENEVVGDNKAIMAVANMLERDKVQFKISNSGGQLPQRAFDRAGYKFWLNPTSSFA